MVGAGVARAYQEGGREPSGRGGRGDGSGRSIQEGMELAGAEWGQRAVR